MMHRPTTLSVALATLLGVSTSASAQELTRTVEYTVQKGDTCWAIAKKLYGDPWKYKTIKTRKKTCPDKIVPGQILTMPHPEEVAKLPDARVDRARGDVTARAPKDSWSKAGSGLDLWRKWKVNAGDSSSARIGFTANGGRLELRENTLVVIYGPKQARVGASNRATASASLEKGSLRARLGELAGEDVSVETPSAQADLGGGGNVLVSVDISGTTRVSNHDGGKVEIARRRKKKKKKSSPPKKVNVPKGMGSKVEPGLDPTPPKPLPSHPAVSEKLADAVRLAGRTSGARITWNRVDGAAAYRVAMCEDATCDEPIDHLTIPSRVNEARFKDLPAGVYYFVISTIDSDAFESKPSDPIKLTVHELALKSGDGPVRRFDTLEAPEGVTCSTGSEFARTVRFETAGRVPVTCKANENTIAARTIDVSPIEVSIASEGASTGASMGSRTLEITEGQQTRHTIELSAPVEDLKIVSENVEVLSFSPSPDDASRWELVIKAPKLGTGKLTIASEDAQVATLPVIIRKGDDAIAPEPLRVSAHGGWAAFNENELGMLGDSSPSWEAGAAASIGVFGIVCAQADLGVIGLTGGDGAIAFVPQVGANIALPFPIEPILGASVGAAVAVGDGVSVAPVVSGYAGARAPLTDPFSLRLQIDGRGVFADGDDPTRHVGASIWLEWTP